MTTRCLFLRACVEPDAEFADVAALGRFVHELRAGAPVVLKRVIVTTPDHNRGLQGLAVRLADTGEGLGYAIVGDMANDLQWRALAAELAALAPDAVAPDAPVERAA